jgi:DNA-binding GntR family transcriptional regulator
MDVLEVRASLDGLATALAAERITDDELKELKFINGQFCSYIEKENLNGSIKKDAEFHDIIYKASRNDKLITILNNLREQVQRFRVIYLKDYSSPKNLIREHNDIFDAVSTRTIESARSFAKMHILNQEATILSSIKMQKPNL